MEPNISNVIVQYADRCFAYAVVIWLLYERKDVTNAIKGSLEQLTLAVGKLTTIIEERIK